MEIINLITVTIPPQLPLALSLSLSSSYSRLQEKGINCVNPSRVLAAGAINCAAFDKTGTLTHEGLSLKEIWSVSEVSGENSEVSEENFGHLGSIFTKFEFKRHDQEDTDVFPVSSKAL